MTSNVYDDIMTQPRHDHDKEEIDFVLPRVRRLLSPLADVDIGGWPGGYPVLAGPGPQRDAG